MKLTRLAVGVLAFSAFLVGCKPSAKNEEQYWNNHQKNSAEYSARWPGFKQVLEAQKAKAQPVWEEAAKISDEKLKAEKMKEANEIFGKLVSRMGEVKYKIEGIESTISKLNQLKLTKTQDSRRKEAVAAAYETLDDVNAALNKVEPASYEEAESALKPQISSLISAQGSIDRAYDALKPARETKKKK